jgi:plasmid stabilization system protein ParE
VAWRVTWAEPAWANVEAAARYIANDSPRYAAALIRDARDAARSLRQLPHRGRVVPEEADPAVRELFVFHQRYRMLYEIVEKAGEVRILAFIHGARNLATALDEQQ